MLSALFEQQCNVARRCETLWHAIFCAETKLLQQVSKFARLK